MAKGYTSYKKPWLYHEYGKLARAVFEREIYATAPEMESQFKKPYRYVRHPESELIFSPPGGGPGYIPGGGWPGGTPPDCSPVGDAVGGGAMDPCDPNITCGQWVWTCAHKIVSFGVIGGNGWIQSIQYGADDTVTVTVCWDESHRINAVTTGSLVRTVDGAVFESKIDFLDCCPTKSASCTSCDGCPELTISYTSQQMAVDEGQQLTAIGGGGDYTWHIMSGGGTLSAKTGPITVYTAPSSNPDCVLNPVIQLKDCCNEETTLQLAVNASSGIYAYTKPYCVYEQQCEQIEENLVGCRTEIDAYRYGCDNTLTDNIPCIVGGAFKEGTCDGACSTYYTCQELFDLDPTICWPYTSGQQLNVYFDIRSEADKANGCCPAQLL